MRWPWSLDPNIRPELQPSRLSRLAAMPIRALDWLIRKAFRL